MSHVIVKFRDCSYALCIRKEPIFEQKMSLEAKGLLTLLCSIETGVLEDDYDLKTALAKYTFESEDKIDGILKELSEFGYVEGIFPLRSRANSTIYVYDSSLCDGRFNDWTVADTRNYINGNCYKNKY